MQSGSNWEIPAIEEQADFAWGAVESPRFNADTEGIPWTDSISYSIWEGSNNQDAAWELVKFLSDSDAQRIAAEANVWSPNSPEIWQELGWDTDPILSISYNELLKDTVIPNYLRSRFFFDCAYAAHSNARVRWIENGERDMETILAEETATAQSCLDDSYGG
jgi:ABC-type glycerol-3-phosphate transport system substrate-binding protein